MTTTLFYRSLVEQSPDLLSVIDLSGTVQYQNPSVERVLGLDASAVVGESIFANVHDDDAPTVREAFGQSLATDQASSLVRFRCRHSDATWRTLEAICQPFIDAEGRTMGVVNSRDITERDELERQVRHAQKMEAMGRLTGAIAHDFNTVLQAIQGYTGVAMCSDDLEAIWLDLSAIKSSAEIGATLTARLLAFSRRTRSAPERLDVHIALRDLERLIGNSAGPLVEVVFDLRATRTDVRFSPSLLELIVMNLAANAKEAMPQGGRLVIATTSLPVGDAAGAPGFLAIDVTDSGEGIRPEIASRLFDPYFTTSELGGGTGIGLSLVCGILQGMGGRIEVESSPGKGTRFRVLLPLTSEAPAMEVRS